VSLPVAEQRPREAVSPLFNANKLKLGVFFANIGGGARPTAAEDRLPAMWPVVAEVARMADAAGLEAMVPLGRWLGVGGESEFCDNSYEPFTWAAGLAQATQRIGIFSTVQVPVYHPALTAKMTATIDHISGGRVALNIVCGSMNDDLALFETPPIEHDEGYDYASEWLEVVMRLWSDPGEFAHDGRYFHIHRGGSKPKPIQLPYPAIMNAGRSEVGQRWAAQHSDMMFTAVTAGDNAEVKARVDHLKSLGREYGRDVQVWMTSSVVCRSSQQEAEDYLDYYAVERGDFEVVAKMVREPGLLERLNSLPPEQARLEKRRLVGSSFNMQPLVGTPRHIAERVIALSQAGIDGLLLTFVNYQAELRRWISDVLPLLEEAGLRERVPSP
jgi:alkanesulfonate monooxygenase SsuD/methylene tetrahydromethanopterin reductase-like flavin-dependent oxidoreductase (luciferase family)